MRLSGFLELPRLAKESPSPTWQARGGRWVGFSGLSSSISCTIGTSPMGSATCVEQRGHCPGLACCGLSGRLSSEFRVEPFFGSISVSFRYPLVPEEEEPAMRSSVVKRKLSRNEPVLITCLHLTDPSV